MALLCSDAVQVAPLRLCSYLLFYLLLLSLLTHITSALITYDKGTLLDIGHRFTNLLQDTLSPNSSWPPEILQNADEENNGHRRWNKKHHGKSAGIRNRLRKRAHSPPLPSILLTNVQSLENKMDDLRARISFQRDIRDCNIICLTETWLTPSVPDTAVTPSDNFSQADTGLALSKLHDVLSGYINKHPDAAFIIVGDFNKANLRQVMTNIHQHTVYPVQPEDRIHWIIATLSLRMPTKPAHYRLLANRTMPPFSSHRNINKGSLRNPR